MCIDLDVYFKSRVTYMTRLNKLKDPPTQKTNTINCEHTYTPLRR